MSNSEKETQQELSAVMEETGNAIVREYHEKFLDILGTLGLLSEVEEPWAPVPLEVWIGIAQALADASGYQVILQATILQPINDHPGNYRSVGTREVAVAEPILFVHE